MASTPKQSPAPDHEPDDELLDDDLSTAPARATVGMRIVHILLFVVVTGMVVYLVLIVLYPERFAQQAWIGATQVPKETAAGRRAVKGFGIGGVVLGMTPADVKAIYPDTRFEPVPDAGLTGVFRHHDGDYQLWFHGPERGERSYAIRSRHVYATVSYVALLGELGDKFGQPDSSNCGAEEGTIAIRCQLRWAMPDVALDAHIRTAAPAAGAAGGAAATTLTVTATDLRPDSMFLKPAARVPAAKKPARPAY